MTSAISFSRQNDAGSRVSNTQYWEFVLVLVSESKGLYFLDPNLVPRVLSNFFLLSELWERGTSYLVGLVKEVDGPFFETCDQTKWISQHIQS